MSDTEFTPRNEFERLILAGDTAGIVREIVEQKGLTRPDILLEPEFFSLPLRTAMLIVQIAMTQKTRQDALDLLKRARPDSEVIFLLEDALEPPFGKLSGEENRLMEAILNHDDKQILHLIYDEEIVFEHVSGPMIAQLVSAMEHLRKETIVRLFHAGFHYRTLGILLIMLLYECTDPRGLKDMDYRKRLMYANLLIHILQGEITPDDTEKIEQDWYPVGNSLKNGRHAYSYYYDPQSLYAPGDPGNN